MGHDSHSKSSGAKAEGVSPDSEAAKPDALSLGAGATDAAGLVQYAAGAIVSRTIIDNASGSVTLFAFDAGTHLSEHTVPFDAVVLVLEGRAELVVGGKAMSVGTGQLAVMPANVPHAVNPGGAAGVPFKMMLSMLKR